MQDTGNWIFPSPLHAPPVHYSFTLADPYASLPGGQRQTIGHHAFAQTRPWFHHEPAAFRVAYLSGQPADVSVRSSCKVDQVTP